MDAEPLHNCPTCGFVMHSYESECVKCQILESYMKKTIAANYTQKYEYLATPRDLKRGNGGYEDF